MSTLKIKTARAFKPLLSPSRYKGAYGGRGGAKSHFFAENLIAKCILNEGTRWACIREVQKSLDQSVKRLLEDKIQTLNVGHLFNIKAFEIGTPGGGVIIFQGMQNHTAESIKSLEGFDGAWVEEAQSLSQRSLDLLRPTIRKEGSELWFSWNPNMSSDPVDVLLRGESPPPDSIVISVSYKDNPWLPDVLMGEIEYDRQRDPDKFAHIWLGGYQRNSESRVFRNWQIEDFTRPIGTIYRLGADWGFASDPSVLIRCSIDGNRLYIDYEAYSIGCEIVNLPELFMSIPEAEKWPITADSARPETISHMQKHGFPKIRSAIKGAKSIEDGIEWLKSFDIIVHPRCTHAIDELTLYSYEVDNMTNEILPKLADKNNHVIDALRYACEGARRAAATVRKPTIQREFIQHDQGWMA